MKAVPSSALLMAASGIAVSIVQQPCTGSLGNAACSKGGSLTVALCTSLQASGKTLYWASPGHSSVPCLLQLRFTCTRCWSGCCCSSRQHSVPAPVPRPSPRTPFCRSVQALLAGSQAHQLVTGDVLQCLKKLLNYAQWAAAYISLDKTHKQLCFAGPTARSGNACICQCHVAPHLYRFSVEWHMQLMQWLPPKWVATEASRAAWYCPAM